MVSSQHAEQGTLDDFMNSKLTALELYFQAVRTISPLTPEQEVSILKKRDALKEKIFTSAFELAPFPSYSLLYKLAEQVVNKPKTIKEILLR